MTPPRTLRVSVVQTCCQAYDLDATLAKLEELTRLAKERDGSQLAVFPEAFIGGYPKLSTFGAVVGDRTPAGRDEYLRYHAAAIEIPFPSPSTQSSTSTSTSPSTNKFPTSTGPATPLSRIESISAAFGVFLVIGVIERERGGGGTLYCTQIHVDPERGLVGRHRKLVPTAVERVIWGRGEGGSAGLGVVEKRFKGRGGEGGEGGGEIRTKIAGAICWENMMPLLRYYYYTQGTELYCVSTVDARPAWQHSMAHIAMEGRCFVLSACQYAQVKHYPAGHPTPATATHSSPATTTGTDQSSSAHPTNEADPETVMIAGGSVIVSPLGEVLAGPLLDGEGVLTATIDLDDCIRGKFDLDVVGHYARPDVFGFTANV